MAIVVRMEVKEFHDVEPPWAANPMFQPADKGYCVTQDLLETELTDEIFLIPALLLTSAIKEGWDWVQYYDEFEHIFYHAAVYRKDTADDNGD